ncbi:MAG TPA: sensor domain-containing protein [Clostridia bacterium]|nr:sensor domain-containing protein [Clostridia bacterium]
MEQQTKPLEKFFTDLIKSVIKPQSYMNICYLLFSFPLGIIYFTFAVTGLSVGIGLIPAFLIGIPILMFILLTSKRIMSFERGLVTGYLKMELPEYFPASTPCDSLITKIKNEVTDPVSWKSIIFLIMKLPLGIFNFTIVVTFFSLSLGFLAAPIVYLVAGHEATLKVFDNDLFVLLSINMSPETKSAVYAVIGFMLVFVSVHISNLLAYLNGKIVGLMYEKW